MKPLSEPRAPRAAPRGRDRAAQRGQSLTDLRGRIDAIDDAILTLLAERADVARLVGEVKRRGRIDVFHDPEREREVLDRLAAKASGAFPRNAVRAVFREIMSGCLSIEEPMRVAYLGPEGTFSQLAARRIFGLSARYRECATIEAVFEAVSSGDATYGVVPFENSTEGAVTSTSDALIEGPLKIRQEHVLPVSHCLIGRARSLADVETVYSHPQALAQCRGWLAKHLPHAQIVQTTSTAAAAREAKGDDRAVAVGGALAADLHGLPILRDNVQDRPENATRFVVLARGDAPPSGKDRTTLAFGLPDAKGALRRVLAIFESAKLNLTRIESRPSQKRPWHYVFLVDIEGHRKDDAVAAALARASKKTDFLRVVGSYPSAPTASDKRRARRKRGATTTAKRALPSGMTKRVARTR